jgi:pyruvate/2-oxoglutarate/acetoin dehydrogenase E1 component
LVRKADVVECLAVEEHKQAPFHSQINEAWFTKTPGLWFIQHFLMMRKDYLNNSMSVLESGITSFEHKYYTASSRFKDYYTIPLKALC